MDKVSARMLIRKQKKTTMGRGGMKALCMVVFCMLAMPLVLSFVLPGKQKVQEDMAGQNEMYRTADSGYYVTCERETGVLRIPMEDYLFGMVAQLMEPDAPAEALRALVVLLRTQVIYETEHEETCVVENFKLPKELRAEWGGQAEEYEQLYRAAVCDTAGIVMTWQGELMETAYHSVSAGSTRSGSLDSVFPYLRSVPCEGDLMSPSYRNRIVFGKEEFFEKLRMLAGDFGITSAQVTIDERDEADYVVSLSICPDGAPDVQIGGETFRLAFHLPSSNFTMEEEDDNVIFLCKGVGHGFGMSLYTAGLLAQEDKDFMEIIRYFYPEAVFMRIA